MHRQVYSKAKESSSKRAKGNESWHRVISRVIETIVSLIVVFYFFFDIVALLKLRILIIMLRAKFQERAKKKQSRNSFERETELTVISFARNSFKVFNAFLFFFLNLMHRRTTGVAVRMTLTVKCSRMSPGTAAPFAFGRSR